MSQNITKSYSPELIILIGFFFIHSKPELRTPNIMCCFHFFCSTSQGLMNPFSIHTSIQMRDRATLQLVQVHLMLRSCEDDVLDYV